MIRKWLESVYWLLIGLNKPVIDEYCLLFAGTQILSIAGFTTTSITVTGTGGVGNTLEYTDPNGITSPISVSGNTQNLPGLFPGRLYTITLRNSQGEIIDKLLQTTSKYA